MTVLLISFQFRCPYNEEKLSLFSYPVISNSATPWPAAQQASLSLTISQSLPKFMSIVSVMPFSHFILWCPLLLLPSIFPSIRDFSNESAVHIRWPKYWSFSISPSNVYSGLISLKIDWFYFLAVQGIFRSLLQHHSLKASVLQWHDGATQITNPETYPTSRFPKNCIINYLTV